MVVFLLANVGYQVVPTVTISFDTQNCTGNATVRGVGFSPNVSVALSMVNGLRQIVGNGWANTLPDGSFEIPFELKGCGAFSLFAFDGGGLGARTELTVPLPQSTTPVIDGQFPIGATVTLTDGAVGHMNPQNDSFVIQYPNLVAGTRTLVIAGPLVTSEGTWYRIRTDWITTQNNPSESVSWVNSSLYPLVWDQSVALTPPQYPVLTTDQPQAASIFSRINLIVRPQARAMESRFRVGVLPPNTIVPIVGQNESGTFILVQLPSGAEGWLCSHLTLNNMALLSQTVPMITGSGSNYCNGDNRP